MRSTAVHKVLSEAWNDELSEAGFRRVPGSRGAAWWRAEPDGNLLFSVGVVYRRWDPLPGSSFGAQYELSSRLGPRWSHPDLQGVLGQDFGPRTLDAVRAQQHAVIARLPRRPHEELPPERHDRDSCLTEVFELTTADHPHDAHFRYLTEEDVRDWAALLRPLLVDGAAKFLSRLRHARVPFVLTAPGKGRCPSCSRHQVTSFAVRQPSMSPHLASPHRPA